MNQILSPFSRPFTHVYIKSF